MPYTTFDKISGDYDLYKNFVIVNGSFISIAVYDRFGYSVFNH